MLKIANGFNDIIDVKQWRFPCGEVGVSLDATEIQKLEGAEVKIFLNWEGNDDLFALAQLVDILRHAVAAQISLYIPYFPYSRQDRRVNEGEAHALKVVASFINSLNLHIVLTDDAHSTVLEGLVNNLHNRPQEHTLAALPVHEYLIAPDAGAAKKIYKHGQVVSGDTEVLIADKSRDKYGKITATTCSNAHHIFNKKVCVVDDICDGGATFLELGKLLRLHEPSELNLAVTHGFFTKGLDELLKIYDNIYVHNLPNKAFATQIKGI